MLGPADISRARERIASRLRLTPVMALEVPTPGGPLRVMAKLESLQHTGSFKPRGAFNSLLQMDAPEILACSGGNHGLAVAYAARVLGRRARIVVPKSAARSKVDAMARHGAEVVQVGDVPADAFAEAARMSADSGWPLIHPYDQEPTIAGQGTLGLELLEQAPEVTRWLLAVGGGGFPAGVALAMAGRAEVVPVEPELCPGLFEAQRAGHPVVVRSEGIARTSLGAPRIGDLAWDLLKERVAPCVLVSEAAIREAQLWLWREARLAAEPGGATAVAALMSGAWAPPDGAPVGFVLCGGNLDELPG
ncbi:MAG TPA: threonine/serine dehydratase [Holophagaceae bacterium]|nr:threonine/serine dehydratase [Holophagaceae bacterium]